MLGGLAWAKSKYIWMHLLYSILFMKGYIEATFYFRNFLVDFYPELGTCFSFNSIFGDPQNKSQFKELDVYNSGSPNGWI